MFKHIFIPHKHTHEVRINVNPINPFKPNEISNPYQLDESVSVLRVVGWYFQFFFSNFNRKFCKETVETQCGI